jgi:hypothetical protein
MTKTEAVIQALEAVLAAAALPPLGRNTNTFNRVATYTVTTDAGDISAEVGFVLFDGQCEVDGERSGPGLYEIEHTAELEILVQGEHCDAVFDAILEAVGAAVDANQTDPDLPWDFLRCGVPQRDFAPAETQDSGKSCVLPIIATFRSPQPF